LARWGGVHVDNMRGLGTFISIFKIEKILKIYVLDVWD
jgi:hypothetical protein